MLSAQELEPPVDLQEAAGRLEAADSKSLGLFALGLDDNRTTFLPGQRVEGQLSLSLRQPALVQLLRIRFTGFISTHVHRKDKNLIDSSSTATLFKDLQTCIGGSSILEKPVPVAAGDYVYPFSFRVPALALPPSYEGIYGVTRYEVGAVLVRPGHANRSTNLILTVPSTLDSDADIYNNPVENTVRKSVGKLLWNCGHVDVRASIPRQAYSSEETIPLTINIVNQSNAQLELHSIVLKQKTSCKTPDDTRGPKTERIHRLEFSETYLPQLREIKRVINFPIPPASVISPSIRTAILDVSHFLVIKVLARGSRGAKMPSSSDPVTVIPTLVHSESAPPASASMARQMSGLSVAADDDDAPHPGNVDAPARQVAGKLRADVDAEQPDGDEVEQRADVDAEQDEVEQREMQAWLDNLRASVGPSLLLDTHPAGPSSGNAAADGSESLVSPRQRDAIPFTESPRLLRSKSFAVDGLPRSHSGLFAPRPMSGMSWSSEPAPAGGSGEARAAESASAASVASSHQAAIVASYDPAQFGHYLNPPAAAAAAERRGFRFRGRGGGKRNSSALDYGRGESAGESHASLAGRESEGRGGARVSFLSDCMVKVEIPFVIGGFPNTLYEGIRQSIDTLPEYERGDEIE